MNQAVCCIFGALLLIGSVQPLRAAALVVISSLPHGMAQPAGPGGAADFFSLTNVGDAAAKVTLQGNGTFFAFFPASFDLRPDATQIVTITSLPQPSAGLFQGAVLISDPGLVGIVPIRLLASDRPTADAHIGPALVRGEFRAFPSILSPPPTGCQYGGNGCVPFTNSGPSAVQAIAVADVQWVSPPPGIITIQPGQTTSVCFDFCYPASADAVGKISLVFLDGPAGRSATVSVPFVAFTQPVLNPGSPPPLQTGETALFVSGLGNRPNALGDLFIASRSDPALVSDLRLYLQAVGSAAAYVAIPQLPPLGLSLPGLLKNFFSSAADKGNLQIRGTDLSKIAVAAIQFNTSASSGAHGTPLPVFRSDRGIAAGDQMLIAGVLKQPGVQTDLLIQELTGNPAVMRVESLDLQGNVVSSRPQDSLAPFAALAIPDAVPERAVAVRITNASVGVSRINAYALVGNPASGDTWVVTDPTLDAPTDSTFMVPVLTSGAGSQPSVFTTNRLPMTGSEVVDVRSVVRRRVVATLRQPSRGVFPAALAATTYTIGPFSTYEFRIVSTPAGFVRIDSQAGSISASGRSTRSVGNILSGTALPARSTMAAVGIGDLKRFPGVEDASTISRASLAPATFRTNLILLEGAGQSATVRVTLHYAFVASATVSASAVSRREYALQASQYLIINDVTRDVIGNPRDAFGDLHDMELDIEVIAGSGRVLPFLQTIDNGSGDMFVRAD